MAGIFWYTAYMRLSAFFSHNKKTLLFIGALCFYSVLIAYATPPDTQYSAGETLDPTCLPGSDNCSVSVGGSPAGSNTELQFNNSGSFGASSGLTFSGSTLSAPNLNITGTATTIAAPTNLHAAQTCAEGCAYTADNYTHNYRVYSYKVVNSSRIYSGSYASLSPAFTDDGSDNGYDITLTWTAASGADGYRILKQDDYNGYNFDVGYDTTSTTFYDDACVSFCFDGGLTDTTPTASYSNTSTINGTLSLTGPLIFQNITSDTTPLDTTSSFLSVDSDGTIGLYSVPTVSQAIRFVNTSYVGQGSGPNSNGTSGSGGSNIFIGDRAGDVVSNSFNNVFLGVHVGLFASGGFNNYIGFGTGTNTTGAFYTNIIGYNAGIDADDVFNANFIGVGAGSGASAASYSNFIGNGAGGNAVNAAYSNLIGYGAGNSFTNNTIGANNIIIGTNVSLPNATANAINIGGVLFGTGIYSTTSGNPSIAAVAGGRIGIGVVSPSVTLDISDAVGFNPLVNIANTSATGYSQIRYTGTGRSYFSGVGNASESNFGVANSWYVYDNNASAMRFVIDSTGKVGIGGTATPQNLLDVYTTSGANKGIDVQNIGTGATDTVSLKLLSAGGTYGQLLVTNSNHATLPSVTALYTQSTNGFVILDTNSNQLLNVKQTGRVGIANSGPSYLFHVGTSAVSSGIVARFQNIDGTCDVNPTAGAGGFACSSDRTLKKDITPLSDDILSKVLALEPVTYHWNREQTEDALHAGFIAQDVETIFPDLVSTDPETNLKSLNYSGLIPYTIKALAEINLELTGINDIETQNTFRDTLIAWFANAGNHIARIFTGELCLTDSDGTSECINKTELHQLKALLAVPATTDTSSTTGGQGQTENDQTQQGEQTGDTGQTTDDGTTTQTNTDNTVNTTETTTDTDSTSTDTTTSEEVPTEPTSETTPPVQ